MAWRMEWRRLPCFILVVRPSPCAGRQRGMSQISLWAQAEPHHDQHPALLPIGLHPGLFCVWVRGYFFFVGPFRSPQLPKVPRAPDQAQTLSVKHEGCGRQTVNFRNSLSAPTSSLQDFSSYSPAPSSEGLCTHIIFT